mgnify:CR=1
MVTREVPMFQMFRRFHTPQRFSKKGVEQTHDQFKPTKFLGLT